MNILARIYMYMYIFRPSSRGVNTISAKKWFRKMYIDNKKNRKSAGALKKAHREGYLLEYMDAHGEDPEEISLKDYLYLQPLNGLYSKWLSSEEITEKMFYPFSDKLEIGAEPDFRVIVVNGQGHSPVIADAYDEDGKRIVVKDELESLLKEMALFVPQLCFFAADVKNDGDSFLITALINDPEYPRNFQFGKIVNDFLTRKKLEAEERAKDAGFRRANMAEHVKLKVRLGFARAFFPKGLRPYLSIEWTGKVFHDLFSRTGEGLGKKIWAYRHGFLSYRLSQYGITRKNHRDFISDFEYSWLRHINGDYCFLFEDKISLKYIVNSFHDCFPEYYYHIRNSNSGNVVIKMMDCPEDRGRDYEDILALAREKGELALKPDTGSHGNGFCRLTYDGDKYYLNFKEASPKEIISMLDDEANQYLVTEFISNHPQFKKIYEGAVNTIRLLVFKDENGNPQIGNAYMRFGSSKTGTVDNMGAGGIFAELDIESGRYHDAKIITHNSIIPCEKHPDTNVIIEGIVPHWEDVKNTVLAVARDIKPMEYFGFDVAITERGVKFPEINRFPDYPKIEKLSPKTTAYLLKKLEEKKKRTGYDRRPCRKLVHLPKR